MIALLTMLQRSAGSGGTAPFPMKRGGARLCMAFVTLGSFAPGDLSSRPLHTPLLLSSARVGGKRALGQPQDAADRRPVGRDDGRHNKSDAPLPHGL